MSIAYTISRNCLGLAEIPGTKEHPAIRWAFNLCGMPNASDDKEAWCGAWQCLTATLADDDIPRNPARARAWLLVGKPVDLKDAQEGDTVVLMRGEGKQPGPEVIDAPGHVGRLVSVQNDTIAVLGGNQSNAVTIAHFPKTRILGIRRPV